MPNPQQLIKLTPRSGLVTLGDINPLELAMAQAPDYMRSTNDASYITPGPNTLRWIRENGIRGAVGSTCKEPASKKGRFQGPRPPKDIIDMQETDTGVYAARSDDELVDGIAGVWVGSVFRDEHGRILARTKTLAPQATKAVYAEDQVIPVDEQGHAGSAVGAIASEGDDEFDETEAELELDQEAAPAEPYWNRSGAYAPWFGPATVTTDYGRATSGYTGAGAGTSANGRMAHAYIPKRADQIPYARRYVPIGDDGLLPLPQIGDLNLKGKIAQGVAKKIAPKIAAKLGNRQSTVTAAPPTDAGTAPEAGRGGIRGALQKAGISRWIDQPLAPAVQLRVRRGHPVSVRNTGTAEAPVWEIRPVTAATPAAVPAVPVAAKGLRQGSKLVGQGLVQVGFAGAALAAKAALGTGVRTAQQEAQIRSAPFRSNIAPGATTQVGLLQHMGVDALGAILVDSDGLRVKV